MAVQQNQIAAADDVTDPTKPATAPKVQNTAVPGATGNPAVPMTPPAPTPTPVPTNSAPVTPPAMPAPTVGPATFPTTTTTATAQPAQTPANPNTPTYDPVMGGYIPPSTVVTAGAANNPVGNAAFQWVTDPLTGAFVKAGQENVRQADGSYLAGDGTVTDPVGTTHTSYFDGGTATGGAVPESMQRPGGPVTWAGGAPPAAGQFGGPPATPTQILGAPTSNPTPPTVGPASPGYINGSGLNTPNVAKETNVGSSGGASSGAPAIGGSLASGVNTGAIDPTNDLRGQTILPDNEPSRLDIANRELKNYEDQALPQFRNKLRSTYQNNAALGRNGSGMLRTDVGNLDLAEQNAYNAKKTSLLDAALGDTIGDNRSNRDEYRTERGREDALEGQAYDRGIQGLTLEDALTNSSFGRALAQQNAGNANNPAQTQLLLSQIFGQQASGAGNALSNMIRGNASAGAVNGGSSGSSGINPADVWAWIQKNLPQGTPGGTQGDTSEDGYGVAP